MKVVSLTRTDAIGPSTRYRVEQYRPFLAREGIHLETLPLFGPTWFAILEMRPGVRRLACKSVYALSRLVVRVGQAVRARCSGADVIHVEQQLFPYLPAALERLLWPTRTPTVLEFDDALYLTPGHRAKLERLCSRADLVIVGNRFLEPFARAHARHFAVIPTTLDLSRYEEARKLQARRRQQVGGPFRVGWIGLRYNLPYLDPLARPLHDLSQDTPGCELVVVSSGLPEGPAWAAVPRRLHAWSEVTEANSLAECDVGIMPLPDTEWARGKCALKLLQYMATGLPVVASPVGVNADLIHHGENGLLASTPAQWQEALRLLRDDAGLRTRLGEEGRRTVEADYSVEGGARQVAEAYGFASRHAEGRGES